jgi:hypothetical protein
MFFRKTNAEKPMPAEFGDVIARLEDERTQVTPLELDQIKIRAMGRAQRRATRPPMRGAQMRRTFIVALATFSLMAGGTGAVIAGTSQKSDGDNDADGQGKSAGKKQYSHCNKSNPQPNCVPKTCKKSQNPQNNNCTPKHSGNGSNGSHKNKKSAGSHQSQ